MQTTIITTALLLLRLTAPCRTTFMVWSSGNNIASHLIVLILAGPRLRGLFALHGGVIVRSCGFVYHSFPMGGSELLDCTSSRHDSRQYKGGWIYRPERSRSCTLQEYGLRTRFGFRMSGSMLCLKSISSLRTASIRKMHGESASRRVVHCSMISKGVMQLVPRLMS